jgi:hypothetical protein
MGRIGLRVDQEVLHSEVIFACEDLLTVDPRVIREGTAEICITVRVPIASVCDINVVAISKCRAIRTSTGSRSRSSPSRISARRSLGDSSP